MTTPKQALERIIQIYERNAGRQNEKLADIPLVARAALAPLQGEDAIERVELPLARAINDVLNAMVDAQAEMTTTKISARILGDDTVRAILSTIAPDEAAIRADEREKCAKVAEHFRPDVGIGLFCNVLARPSDIAAAIRSQEAGR